MKPVSTRWRSQDDLLYYWRQIYKRRWWVLAIVLVSLSIGLFQIAKTRPLYQASAKLLIERASKNLIPFADPLETSGSTASYYQTQYELLRSRSLARRLIETLNLAQHPEFAQEALEARGWGTWLKDWGRAQLRAWLQRGPAKAEGASADSPATSDQDRIVPKVLRRLVNWTGLDKTVADIQEKEAKTGGKPQLQPDSPAAPESVKPAAIQNVSGTTRIDNVQVNHFLKRLRINLLPSAHIVGIQFIAYDPKLAASVPNTLAHLYIETSKKSRFAAVQEALDWLNKQVNETNKDIEKANLKLQEFKKENNIYATDERLSDVMQQISTLNGDLTKVIAERIDIESFLAEIKQATDDPEALQDLFLRRTVNPVMQELVANYLAKQQKVSILKLKYGSEYPQVSTLLSEITLIKNRLSQETHKAFRATVGKYRALHEKEKLLQKTVDKLKLNMQELNQKAIQYDALKRDAEGSRQLSDLLLTRLKQTSISSDLSSMETIRIVDEAEIPVSPINIRTARTLTRAGLIGLCVGVVIVLGLSYLDSTLKSLDDAEDLLGLPVVGAIVQYDDRRRLAASHESSLVTLQAPHSPVSEAFKTLRTNLLLSYRETPRKVFLVTSTHPNEGKTTIAANLALVMSQMEQRVLLVEADLRNPGIAKLFDLKNSEGLSELLLQTDYYDDDLQSYDPNLFIVPAGKRPPNPSELLSSARMKQFISFARDYYDVIIIDSPPLLAVSDAMILSQMADTIVIAIRAGTTHRDHVRYATQQLLALQSEAALTGPLHPHDTQYPSDIPRPNVGVVMNFLDPSERGSYGYYHGYYAYPYTQKQS